MDNKAMMGLFLAANQVEECGLGCRMYHLMQSLCAPECPRDTSLDELATALK